MSLDESTDLSTDQRLSCHVYVSDEFKRRTLFPGLPLAGSAKAKPLTDLLIDALKNMGSMSIHRLQSSLCVVATDGANVMQGAKTGLVTQVKDSHAPFATPQHCAAHRIELVATEAGIDPLLQSVAQAVTSVANFCINSTKRLIALVECQKRAGMNCLKPRQVAPTRLLSLADTIQFMSTQWPAVALHAEERYGEGPQAVAMYAYMTNLKTLLSAVAICPILQELRKVIKALQRRDMYLNVKPRFHCFYMTV